jgi:hypothetical protein
VATQLPLLMWLAAPTSSLSPARLPLQAPQWPCVAMTLAQAFPAVPALFTRAVTPRSQATHRVRAAIKTFVNAIPVNQTISLALPTSNSRPSRPPSQALQRACVAMICARAFLALPVITTRVVTPRS